MSSGLLRCIWRMCLAGAVVLLVAAPSTAGAQDTSAEQSQPMRLVMLGTGTPNADPDRWGPSLAVVVGERAYVFDAGPGVVRRAAAAARTHDLAQLEANNLTHVFLTHLHSDHTLGLPDLMFSPWVLERTAPLHIVGPAGTAAMAARLTDAYTQDIEMRLHGLEPANTTGWRNEVTEFAAGGRVFEDGTVRIDAIPVVHGSWANAYGYSITDGRTKIVISGDATFSPTLLEAARGADILVHEVYSTPRLETRPPEWRRYHSAFHTSTQQLAALAASARPGLVVLTHTLTWGMPAAELVGEMRGFGYDGPVAAADDLDLFVAGAHANVP
ncbi:MAG: MBL fold metallo-hydrolase [Hyphomonadaceae bacterium]